MSLNYGQNQLESRHPITFIAEVFFHGKEKYMLLRPGIERRVSRPP